MLLPWTERQPRSCGGGPLVPTSETEVEAAMLRELAQDRRVLEIGAMYGFSTILLADVARSVVSVDPHTAQGGTWEACEGNLVAHGVREQVTVLLAHDHQALPLFAPGSFDLVWIDGDHSREACEYDGAMAARLLSPGGVIAFHDYGEDTCPEVAPAIDALLAEWGRSMELHDTLAVVRWSAS